MDFPPFVSRAGEKLEFAIQEFKVDVAGKICADFGSSTGGFVDCLLQHGAAKVYSVETGYGEIAWKLRKDKRVKLFERTNAMHVELPEQVDVITIDVSWTKQKHILPNALKYLKDNGVIISLIKPHYEAEKHLLHKGKLTSEDAEQITRETVESMKEVGAEVVGLVKSPIVGGKGKNVEYLAMFKKLR